MKRLPLSVLTTALAVGFLSACSTPAQPAAAPASAAESTSAAPSATPGQATRITDVDGDGRPDVVWAGPDAVAVALANGTVQSVDADALGLTPGADGVSAFGTSVAVGDLNRDGFADVVTVDASASQGDDDVTAIWVLWGAADGISAGRAEVVATAPAWSGRLAVVALPEPVVALGTQEHRSGSVRLYPVDTSGHLGTHRLITLDTPGVDGRIDKVVGSNFGDLLAASGDRLLIGDPGYLTSDKQQDGALWVLRLKPGLHFDAVTVTRASLGLKRGTPDVESFVRSVSILGDQVVVGSGQGWAKHADAGSVTSFRVVAGDDGLAVAGAVELSKDSPGVPGTADANEGWGGKVQAIVLCDGVPGALVQATADSGVDGEREATYGTIVSVPFARASSCPGQLLASGVDAARTAITVGRTEASGSAGESPVVGLADPRKLQLGWPNATTLIDLTGREDVPSIETLAAPAA